MEINFSYFFSLFNMAKRKIWIAYVGYNTFLLDTNVLDSDDMEMNEN
jgi:hypothetical protein